MNLYTEFGETLKDANDRIEEFSAFIQFTKQDEPSEYAEIFVSENEISFSEDKITPEQYKEVMQYAERSQQSIIDYLRSCKDDEDTKSYLYKTAHW